MTQFGVVHPIRRCLLLRTRNHFTVPVLHTGQGNSPSICSLGKSAIMVKIAVAISSILLNLLSRVIFLGNSFHNLQKAVLEFFILTQKGVHFLLHRRSSNHRD